MLYITNFAQFYKRSKPANKFFQLQTFSLRHFYIVKCRKFSYGA